MINSTINIKAFTTALIMGCFFMIGCENKIEVVQNLGKKSIGIEEGKNIESYLSQSGKVKAKLTAPLMLRYLLDTPKFEFPANMHVDFYDDTAAIESKMDCKYGKYFENDNKVYLRDSVVVFNRTGDTLWTDELYWDQIRGEFYTDKFVRVKKGFNANYILGYHGLRADQGLNNITFFNIGEGSYMLVPDSTY
jgi:LPS export ABC transporter protein LptC